MAKALAVIVCLVCFLSILLYCTDSTFDFPHFLEDLSNSRSNVNLNNVLDKWNTTTWTIENEWPSTIEPIRTFINSLLGAFKSIINFAFLLVNVYLEVYRLIFIFIGNILHLT